MYQQNTDMFFRKELCFYYLEANKVRIVRVLNEFQDYMQQLFGDSSELD